ncbi:MAG: flagellar biosynthetic protein FliO [Bryobacteraceae bacterium]|nr:flagellar biosynthetic protein FliO [Bryobacteraceae bacterium]
MDYSLALALAFAAMAALSLGGLRRWGLNLAWKNGARLGRTHGPIESIARLGLTPHQSIHLVRVGDRAMLLAVSSTACVLLESFPWPAGGGKSMQAGEGR